MNWPWQDPHDNTFAAINLNEEEWRLYQRDERTLELAETIKGVFKQGLVAKIKRSLLYDIGLSVAMRTPIPACIVEMSHHDHWVSMALCMLTHGKMDVSDNGAIRFSKSSFDQPPMWFDNVHWILREGKSGTEPVRIKKEVTVTKPEQRGLFDE